MSSKDDAKESSSPRDGSAGAGKEIRPQDRAELTGVGLDNWGDSFPSTHWSIIFDEREEETATQRMLERLCSQYWYPVYAYLRKRGYSSHDAQDYTQGFFSKMLEGDGLAQARPDRGRFRSYIIGAVKHHLSGERKKANAEKRGGGKRIISIDEEMAEKRFQSEPADHLTPEHVFDREWALALLQDVINRLSYEYAKQNKSKIFDVLSEFLTAKPDRGTYPLIAEQLSVSEGNVRVMVNRIRSRYRNILKEAISEMVDDAEDVESELQHLFSTVSS